MNEELSIGDRIELRKAHPCGGKIWEVVRLGADIGIICETCGRKVMIPRQDLMKRIKRYIPKEGQSEG